MLVRSSVGSEATNPSAPGTECSCLTPGKLTLLLLTIAVSPGIGEPSTLRVNGNTLRYGSSLRPYSIQPRSGQMGNWVENTCARGTPPSCLISLVSFEGRATTASSCT